MAILIDHLPFTQVAGFRTFGPAVVPNGTTRVVMRIARCTTLTPTLWLLTSTKLALEAWLSFDGNSWQSAGGIGAVNLDGSGVVIGAEGGIRVIERTGEELTESVLSATMAPGTSRQLQIAAAIQGGTLISELTLETD